MWRPGGGPSRLTYRRLRVLVDHLPPESATKTAIRESLPDELLEELEKVPSTGKGPWSKQELLSAAIADRLAWVIYAISAAAGGKPDAPKPIPRPGVRAVRRKPEYYERLRELRQNRGVLTP